MVNRMRVHGFQKCSNDRQASRWIRRPRNSPAPHAVEPDPGRSGKLEISYQQVQKYETGANRISAGRLMKLPDCWMLKSVICSPNSMTNCRSANQSDRAAETAR